MPKKVTMKKLKTTPKAKAKPKKEKPPEFNETMQDNVLLNTLMLMMKYAYEFESTPEIIYWPHTQTITMTFIEDRMDNFQMEKFSQLCGYPQDFPMNGEPMYRIDVYNEAYDHKEQKMKKVDGMAITLNVDFSEDDWKAMTSAHRGAIIKFDKKA
jgi:hypothetical protein